ncbi:MAG TPA: ATP-binding protein [Alphaproteobacteria bacterium]|nr:ATP-binding protein [Alphaproteobacteria bacterium]
MPSEAWIALALLTILLGAMALAWRGGRAARLQIKRLKSESAAFFEMMKEGPAGLLWWSEGSDQPRASPGLARMLHARTPIADTAQLAQLLAPDDAGRFSSALESLRRERTRFEMLLRLAQSEEIVQATGQPGTGYAAVWFRDVTDWVRDAAQLRQERAALTAALDVLPAPVWRRGPDGRLLYCNRTYARMVDTDPEAAIEHGVEIARGAIGENGRGLALRALGAGEPRSESHHVVAGGTRRLLAITELPGPAKGTIGYAVDLTALEDTQAELERHISAHAEVLETLGTGIVIYGPDGRVKFFNSAFAALWQLDERWLETEPNLGEVLEILRENRRLPETVDFKSFKRDLQKQLLGIIDPIEDLLHLPDGRTLRMVAAPHPFGGVVVTYEDVTDRLALERSHNTLIAVQRETLDHLYEGVALFTGDGRLKLSNPAFARMWNFTPEELAGEPHIAALVDRIKRYFPQGRWSQLREKLIDSVAEPEARSGRMERRDGTSLDWASVPLPDGACLFTYLDVTDSSRVERALRERNEALEHADRLKSEFIANVSYELRTPLNAIIGFAEILDRQYFGPLNVRQIEYSKGIVEASQRLLALINDILDVANIEAGYLQLEVQPVEMKALVQSVEGLAHERLRNRQLTFESVCADDVGLVHADERRLKQALYNLISNAVKFTPEGGRINLTVAREGEELAMTVADTGVGIAPEDQVRVFDKFERGPGAHRQIGAGLGLALVKSLIELHGGRVELKSMPGEGTAVTCRIPARATAAVSVAE